MTTNTQRVDFGTAKMINTYIDDICADSDFLCKNKELCANNTSIYTGIDNVNNICDEMIEASKCESDIQFCVVQATNTFDESAGIISTSFSNIIIPIKNAFDDIGNQKFLRLPALSISKSKKPNEICHICACMERFAKSIGASGTNTDTSPGQNECVYSPDFEYYYYPVYIENINNKLKNPPEIVIGKYKILNSNIINANSEDDLEITVLFEILTKNNISNGNILNFLKNVLYTRNQAEHKKLQLYLLSKINVPDKNKNVKNLTNYYIILVGFLIMLLLYFV